MKKFLPGIICICCLQVVYGQSIQPKSSFDNNSTLETNVANTAVSADTDSSLWNE